MWWSSLCAHESEAEQEWGESATRGETQQQPGSSSLWSWEDPAVSGHEERLGDPSPHAERVRRGRAEMFEWSTAVFRRVLLLGVRRLLSERCDYPALQSAQRSRCMRAARRSVSLPGGLKRAQPTEEKGKNRQHWGGGAAEFVSFVRKTKAACDMVRSDRQLMRYPLFIFRSPPRKWSETLFLDLHMNRFVIVQANVASDFM